MIVFTHGDGDGVCAGTLALMVHPGARVYFSHPAGLLHDLRATAPDEDVVVCDIAFDRRFLPDVVAYLARVEEAGHAVTYIDHHPLVPEAFPGTLVHELGRSATELAYRFFQERAQFAHQFHAERIAIMGAIADYADTTPTIRTLVQKWEKRAIFLETGLLVQGLYWYRRNYDAKRSLVGRFARGEIPSQVETLVTAAISQTNQEEQEIARIEHEHESLRAIAWTVDPQCSKSKAAHWVLGFADKPVGIAIQFRKHRALADFTIRGRHLLDLTTFVPDIAEKYDGHGGGHPNACGLRVAAEHWKAVLHDLDAAVARRFAEEGGDREPRGKP